MKREIDWESGAASAPVCQTEGEATLQHVVRSFLSTQGGLGLSSETSSCCTSVSLQSHQTGRGCCDRESKKKKKKMLSCCRWMHG